MRPKKLTTPLRYVHAAEARPLRPGAQFPLDMLRYDRATPVAERDALEMQAHASSDPHERRAGEAIMLQRYSDTAQSRWSHARWQSFGWEITEVDANS